MSVSIEAAILTRGFQSGKTESCQDDMHMMCNILLKNCNACRACAQVNIVCAQYIVSIIQLNAVAVAVVAIVDSIFFRLCRLSCSLIVAVCIVKCGVVCSFVQCSRLAVFFHLDSAIL